MDALEVWAPPWRLIVTVTVVPTIVVAGVLMLGVSGESTLTAFAIVSGLDPL